MIDRWAINQMDSWTDAQIEWEKERHSERQAYEQI
jgi:hypothetical protein